MSQFLKQSTAASTIVGPILDSTGAEYASAVIGDLSYSANGGTLTALASTATLTYIANGQYTLALNTTNTGTLGRLDITCNKATYQMPPARFEVLQATVFDALVTNAAGGLNGLPLSQASNKVAATIAAGDIATDAITAASLKADAVTEIVAGLLTTAMTESYAADGAAPTLTQALMLIQQVLTEFAISGTTLTVKKLDGSTTALTLTLNDGTSPTGVTRAT